VTGIPKPVLPPPGVRGEKRGGEERMAGKQTVRGLMTVMEHLEELRRVLVISAVAFVAAAGGLMFFADRIVKFLLIPLYKVHVSVIQIRPLEYLFVLLKVSTVGGLILALPVLLWQAWRFIKPGLEPREGRLVFALVPVILVLFLGGVVFGYFTVYQVALRFVVMLGQGVVMPYISISEYIDFTISFLLPFGFVFEMPVVSLILTRLGLITPSYLARQRKYAFFFTFVLAIVLIPDPSLFTQSLLALPMYLLFEVSILLSRIVERRRRSVVAAQTLPAQR